MHTCISVGVVCLCVSTGGDESTIHWEGYIHEVSCNKRVGRVN